jgi:hypothetical protein
MPVQTPQWSEFLSCPVCQNEFEVSVLYFQLDYKNVIF